MRRTKVAIWTGIAVALVAFSIPWFLWGSSAVVAGLPVWLWWHVGWMVLVALVFRLFATSAWGIGIETGAGAGSPAETADTAAEGDRR